MIRSVIWYVRFVGCFWHFSPSTHIWINYFIQRTCTVDYVYYLVNGPIKISSLQLWVLCVIIGLSLGVCLLWVSFRYFGRSHKTPEPFAASNITSDWIRLYLITSLNVFRLIKILIYGWRAFLLPPGKDKHFVSKSVCD